jgi:hypothetical protein
MSAGNGRATTATLARKPARGSSRMAPCTHTPEQIIAGVKRQRTAGMTAAIDAVGLRGHRSVDTLLEHPIDAMRMGTAVLLRLGSVGEGEAEAIDLDIANLLERHGAVIDQINYVCRAAMNGRKRGYHKPPKSKRKGAQKS